MTEQDNRKVVIIGAGPAGLTAALELIRHTDFVPVVLEMSGDIGGLSKTVNYKGNRIDIGGHRFFSKSTRVMSWWQEVLPLQGSRYLEADEALAPFGATPDGPDPDQVDKVMLIRSRLSRIFFLRKFFSYPMSLSVNTVHKLGIVRTFRVGMSYCLACLRPIKPEGSLEDFFINRFGKELYETFFKSYTEKVWGVACSQISPAWGAQRIKGLSVRKAIVHALKQLLPGFYDPQQERVETSLIENFLYPKYGPGQMWEEVARQVQEGNGEIHHYKKVQSVVLDEGSVIRISAQDIRTGELSDYTAEYYLSSMPVKDLILGMQPPVSHDVQEVAENLTYREFITVGVLLSNLRIKGGEDGAGVSDNWIYIQEPDVRIGRVQIFNNWSPYMVADPTKIWLGLEYFCNEGDDLWELSDQEMKDLAQSELVKIGFAVNEDILDSVVIRMEKTYPAYFGSYDRFSMIRECVDEIPNLILIGRNGMHRYNNQDHSMLAAMEAVACLNEGRQDQSAVWNVNAEDDYHEE